MLEKYIAILNQAKGSSSSSYSTVTTTSSACMVMDKKSWVQKQEMVLLKVKNLCILLVLTITLDLWREVDARTGDKHLLMVF